MGRAQPAAAGGVAAAGGALPGSSGKGELEGRWREDGSTLTLERRAAGQGKRGDHL